MNSKRELYSILVSMLPFCIVMALVGCKPGVPNQYIQPDDMEDILYDYHIADGMVSTRPGETADLTQAYHVAVLKKHHVTQSEFDSSMVYYMENAEILHTIYENLSERLQEESRRLGGPAMTASGMYPANGDTTNIWRRPSFMVLTSKAPFNYQSFSIRTDTTYHAGDMLTLSFSSQFIFQDGIRDGNVVLALVLKNDSVITRNLRISTDMQNVLQISDDNFVGIKEIKGYFQLNTSPNVMTTSTMRLMFLENIQFLRFHPQKVPTAVPSDSTNLTKGTHAGSQLPPFQETLPQQENSAPTTRTGSPLPLNAATPISSKEMSRR